MRLLILISLSMMVSCKEDFFVPQQELQMKATKVEVLMQVVPAKSGSSGLGTAVLGGMVWGPVGAVAGAIAGSSSPVPASKELSCRLEFSYAGRSFRTIQKGEDCLFFKKGEYYNFTYKDLYSTTPTNTDDFGYYSKEFRFEVTETFRAAKLNTKEK